LKRTTPGRAGRQSVAESLRCRDITTRTVTAITIAANLEIATDSSDGIFGSDSTRRAATGGNAAD
jgi:hypothetical protein